MHLHPLLTLSTLLPLTLGLSNPPLETPSATPITFSATSITVPADPSPTNPYFLLLDFEVFIASLAQPTMHSRAAFGLTLMHPDPSQGWSTLCKTHGVGELCGTGDFWPCDPVPGAGNRDERLSFRCSEDLASVEIMRLWTYKDMHLKTMASEDTYWDESINGGNVTVSQYGKWYERSEGWVFPWRLTVG